MRDKIETNTQSISYLAAASHGVAPTVVKHIDPAGRGCSCCWMWGKIDDFFVRSKKDKNGKQLAQTKLTPPLLPRATSRLLALPVASISPSCVSVGVPGRSFLLRLAGWRRPESLSSLPTTFACTTVKITALAADQNRASSPENEEGRVGRVGVGKGAE